MVKKILCILLVLVLLCCCSSCDPSGRYTEEGYKPSYSELEEWYLELRDEHYELERKYDNLEEELSKLKNEYSDLEYEKHNLKYDMQGIYARLEYIWDQSNLRDNHKVMLMLDELMIEIENNISRCN